MERNGNIPFCVDVILVSLLRRPLVGRMCLHHVYISILINCYCLEWMMGEGKWRNRGGLKRRCVLLWSPFPFSFVLSCVPWLGMFVVLR